jgi:hypothetical protein
MAEDIIEEIRLHIREILRICRVLDSKGRDLRDLNELVGRMSKSQSLSSSF